MRHDKRVARAALRLRLAKPFGIAFAIAELEWIDDRLGQLDAGVAAVIEQHGEAPLRIESQMMAAIAANEERRLEIAVKQHLAAARTFVPQIVRHVLLRV